MNPLQTVPARADASLGPDEDQLLAAVAALPGACRVKVCGGDITKSKQHTARVDGHYRQCQFANGLEEIMLVLQHANRYFDHAEPWRLKDAPDRRATVLYTTLETLRVCGLLLQPAMPRAAARLLDRLNVPSAARDVGHFALHLGHPGPLGADAAPLFPRLG